MSYSKFMDACARLDRQRSKEGLPSLHYEKEQELVRDEWILEKRYAELVAFILENWSSGNCDDFVAPVSAKLIIEKESKLFMRLWKGIIRHRFDKLWAYHDLSDGISVGELGSVDLSDFNQFSSTESYIRRKAYHRSYTMSGISIYIAGLELLRETAEIERAEALYRVAETLQKPTPGPVTDKRKIDETLFWQLIDDANREAEDRYQFIDALTAKLTAFGAKEMRNFDKWLLTKTGELNNWDIWALAYIVRRGCGDDAFDYFKAWVVSKGKDVFETVKQMDTTKLPTLFTEDPQLEELYYLAGEVFESRTSDIYVLPRVKQSKLTGKQWKEEELRIVYPELCNVFGY